MFLSKLKSYGLNLKMQTNPKSEYCLTTCTQNNSCTISSAENGGLSSKKMWMTTATFKSTLVSSRIHISSSISRSRGRRKWAWGMKKLLKSRRPKCSSKKTTLNSINSKRQSLMVWLINMPTNLLRNSDIAKQIGCHVYKFYWPFYSYLTYLLATIDQTLLHKS